LYYRAVEARHLELNYWVLLPRGNSIKNKMDQSWLEKHVMPSAEE
jgi:hypothetical protein